MSRRLSVCGDEQRPFDEQSPAPHGATLHPQGRRTRTNLLFTMSIRTSGAPRSAPQTLIANERAKRRGNGSDQTGGAGRDRTDDPLLAKQVLSQLSYGPFSPCGEPELAPRTRTRVRKPDRASRLMARQPRRRMSPPALEAKNGGPGRT